MKKLTRSFYNRPTLTVAEELLGKVLIFKSKMGMITETEAYRGFDDPASHAARGKTPRSAIMFGKAGFSYVYLIYGMYYCLNVVTEEEDFPAAVLIRGIKLISDDILLSHNSLKSTKSLDSPKPAKSARLDGPGKLCRYLGISKNQNSIDMTTSNELYIATVEDDHRHAIIQTPRIGIKVGQDKLWRFVISDSH